ncbi:MAG: D-Ala-D-Ala carboxypeptidase family metallohydrolase [Nanoarchaeota archaeon]
MIDIYKTLRTAAATALIGCASLAGLNSCGDYRPEQLENYADTPLRIRPNPTSMPSNQQKKLIPRLPDFNNDPKIKITKYNRKDQKFDDVDSRLLRLSELEYVSNFDQHIYSDPNNSGNRLFRIRKKDLDRKVSEHFTLRELVSSSGELSEYARLDPELISGLEKLRQEVGKPIRVNSGYRSKARQYSLISKNKTNAKKSRHCSGEAVDIFVKGMRGKDLAIIARELFPKAGIGRGKNFIHLDFRRYRADWRY